MKTTHFARAALIVCTMMTTSAFAHDKYKGYANLKKDDCCSDQHCRPLPKSKYTVLQDGTVVVDKSIGAFMPGATTTEGPKNLVVPKNSEYLTTEPSFNDDYHICIAGGVFRCLIPPNGKMTGSPPRFAVASFVPNFSGVRERLASFIKQQAASDGPICRSR